MVKGKKGGIKKLKRKIGAAVHVNIGCEPDGCHVRPPYQRVSRRQRDEVIWHGSNTGAEIYFPTTCPFGWQLAYVPRGGSLASGPPVCPVGEYEYTVYCTACQQAGSRKFAKAHSNPKVIVDP